MKKKKIYLWLELFITVSILILISVIISYLFLQNIIKKQISLVISEDIEKEKDKFLEEIKSILEDKQKNIDEMDEDRFLLLKEMQDLLNQNKYIIACNIFLNRNLIFSYNKSNFEVIHIPPPPPPNPQRTYENNTQTGRFGINRFKPAELKPGFYMEQYVFRTSPLRIFFMNIIFYHEGVKNFLERLRVLFLLFYFVLLIISFPIIFLVSRQFSKPIRNLVKSTFKLSNGDYDVNIENKRNDEIGILIDAFNYLSSELKKDQEFRKKVTSQITHDISTPINIIKSYMYGIKDGIINSDINTILEIDGEIERINELVDQINLFSRIDKNKDEKLPLLSLNEEIGIYIDKIIYLFNKEKLIIQKDVEDNIFYPIRRNHFRSLTENIIKNSIQHNNNDEKKVELTLYSNKKGLDFTTNLKNTLILNGYSYYSLNNIRKEDKKFLCSLTIVDNGIGVNKEELPEIFNKNYKARNGKKSEERWSNGIGLSIVKEICILYEIELEILSKIDNGTTIILNFWK